MFKICPSCGSEFRLTVSVCSDCHVSLEFPVVRPPQSAPPIDEMVVVHRAGPSALDTLAGHLQERGIPSRIDTDPPREAVGGLSHFTYGGDSGSTVELALYVPEGSHRHASDLVEAFIRSRLPEHEAGELGAITTDCPACSAPLPDPATSCSACGLEFGDGGFVCMDCGRPVEPTDTRCANCGQELSAEGS